MYIYDDNLEKVVKITKHFIPRKLSSGEHLVQYHKYWIPDPYIEIFKVLDVNVIGHTEYYIIEYKSMFGTLTYPISKNVYELIIDRNNRLLSKNIVNSNKYISGYKLKYWFYHNRNKESYKNFLPLIHDLDDNKFYKVKGIEENGIFKDCRIKQA